MMRRFILPVCLAVVMTFTVLPGVAADDDDALDLIRTLTRGMIHRQSCLPPLTGAFVEMTKESRAYQEAMAEVLPAWPRTDSPPGVVAVAFREITDTEWELHVQALTRGPNEWGVAPIPGTENRVGVSDLYRLVVVDGQSMYQVRSGPSLDVSPLRPEYTPLKNYPDVTSRLGLGSGNWGDLPYGEMLALGAGVADGRREGANAREMPFSKPRVVAVDETVYRVTVDWYHHGRGLLMVRDLWVDTETYAVRDYRETLVAPAARTGNVRHTQYADFAPVDGVDPPVVLPRSAFTWKYAHYGDALPLDPDDPVSFEVCRLTQVIPSAWQPDGFPPWLRIGTSIHPETRRDHPEVSRLRENLYGDISAAGLELAAFASGEKPLPAPPADLLDAFREALATAAAPQ